MAWRPAQLVLEVAATNFGPVPLLTSASPLGVTIRNLGEQASGTMNIQFSGPDFTVAPTGNSFHSRHPVAALDKIIVHRDLRIDAAGVHMSHAARRASDHLPVWARLSV